MTDAHFMRLALRLARRGYGTTSPNPMVGAVLVKGSTIIGRGWHRRAGEAHAEIEAIRDAKKRGYSTRGATLYVTLEPCSTHGRTPPCTEAILDAGLKCVVIGATDPNPKHSGKGLGILITAGIRVEAFDVPRLREASAPSLTNNFPGPIRSCRREEADGAGDQKGPPPHVGGYDAHKTSGRKAEHETLSKECARLNESFNHWIVHRTPFVTVKAAMTLDGKIATASGESKWITGDKARACGMTLRQGADAILVGVNTVLADDPSLTVRSQESGVRGREKLLRRIVLDSRARTPLSAKVVSDEHAALTTIVVSRLAPRSRVAALAKRVNLLVAPTKPKSARRPAQIDLRWLLKKLGAENVTSLLVEGGGEVNASFLLQGLAHRIAFFYAPKILGGRDARKAVGGEGARRIEDVMALNDIEWRRLGPDLLLTARVVCPGASKGRNPRIS